MTNTVNLTKLTTYAVEQGSYGDVYQDTDADRPLYKVAPSGGVPYIDQSATGSGLKVNVPIAGTYTFVVYKDDQTYNIFEADLVNGENTFPVTDNFNQVVVLLGDNLNRRTLEAIKAGIEARI